jgi:N-acetylneuraminic acid mutarotase
MDTLEMNRTIFLSFMLAILAFLSMVAIRSTAVSADSWTTKASPPEGGQCAAAINGEIYVMSSYGKYNATLGAWNYSAYNYMYNPINDSWTARTPMPTPRVWYTIVAYQNKIYVMGGNRLTSSNGAETQASSVNEVYDPSTDSWSTKASMPVGTLEAVANVLDGKIYVISGRTADEAYTTTNITEIYDPINDSWSYGEAIPYPVVGYASAVVDNRIYVIGGQDEYLSSMNVVFNQVYNPETNSWSQGASIPEPTWQATAGATTGVAAPKRIYIFGGAAGFGEGSNQNYAYDSASDSWVAAAPLPIALSSPAVAVLNDVFYVIGGGGSQSTYEYLPLGYVSAPPVPCISSPENITYSVSSVLLTFTINKDTSWLGYSLDGKDNVTIAGNTTLTELANGEHNVIVYAQDNAGNIGASEPIQFTIAKPEPEPFQTTLVITASGVSLAVVGVGLLVFFKKRKRKVEVS